MKYKLLDLLTEYKETNKDSLYEPVAVGKYGIRKRNEIYKKELSDDYSKNKVIRNNTLIVGMGSNQIDIGVLSDDEIYSVSPAYHTYRINIQVVGSDYLDLLFKANNDYYFRKYSIATARQGKKIDLKSLLNEIVDIPSFEEQGIIVGKIFDINKLIRIEEKSLSLLDELTKSRFNEMFGDDYSTAKYPIEKLGKYMTTLVDFNANGSYEKLDSNVKMHDEPNYAWMVRTTDLETKNYTNIKYIDKKAYELLSKSKIYGNELIMSKIGSAGKIYLMPKIDKPASLGRNAFMMRFDENKVNMNYLFYMLSTDFGTADIMSRTRGAVTKTITKDETRDIRYIDAPITVQNKFASFAEQIDKLKFNCQQRIKLYQELLDKKMDEYFG